MDECMHERINSNCIVIFELNVVTITSVILSTIFLWLFDFSIVKGYAMEVFFYPKHIMEIFFKVAKQVRNGQKNKTLRVRKGKNMRSKEGGLLASAFFCIFAQGFKIGQIVFMVYLYFFFKTSL